MRDPLSAFLRTLGKILMPIGIVAGIAGATAGLAERRKKRA